MYTTTIDSLVLPLNMNQLLSEPENGIVLEGEISNISPSQTNYIYIPNSDFTGSDTFDFLGEDNKLITVTIYVNEMLNDKKRFVPFINHQEIRQKLPESL